MMSQEKYFINNLELLEMTLNRLLTAFVSVIILLIAGVNVQSEESIKPVRNISVDIYGERYDDVFAVSAHISWLYPANEPTATEFKIYAAKGKSNDLNEFQLINTVERNDSARMKDHYSISIDQLIGENIGWTFTITASDGENESEAVSFVYAELKNSNPNNKLFIVSYPEYTGKIGEEYNYLPEIETSVEDGTLSYSLNLIEDAEIDSETGEITWTPQESGAYVFSLIAEINKDGHIIARAQQTWTVFVYKCTELSSISGIVKDEDGNDIKYGTATLFAIDELNGRMFKGMHYQTKISEGAFLFENIDKGEYYILVEAYGKDNTTQYFPNWYNNAISFDDAELFSIDCGASANVSFTVKKVPVPKLYSVSGKVVDAETLEPISDGIVEFIGLQLGSNRQFHQVFRINHNGTFNGMLPDGYSYKAVAKNVFFNSDSSYPQAYFPQYYELADNPTDAKSIILTADRNDIDFYLVKVPNYDNSIFGTVVDIDNEPVEGVQVSAFLVSTNGFNNRYLYMGKSAFTDGFGGYNIENLIPGDYVILANPFNRMLSPGFYVEGEEASLLWEEASRVSVGEEGANGSFKIMLNLCERKKGKGIVRGRIGKERGGVINMDGEIADNDALIGASVYLVNDKGNVSHNLASDNYGEFELTDIAPGKYSLIVDKIGYSAALTDIEIGEESLVEKDLTLTPKNTSSVDDLSSMVFDVYPNPAVENIHVNLPETGSCSVKIINLNGVELNSTVGLSGYHSIDVSELPNGLYFVKVSNGIETSVKTVMVIK